MIDNPISKINAGIHAVLPNAILRNTAVGAGLFGLSALAWHPMVETSRSLLRLPLTKLTGLTDEEWNIAMDEMHNKKYRYLVPLGLAGLTTAGLTAASYNPYKRYGGLLSDKASPYPYINESGPIWKNDKTASLHKEAEDMFSYDGYIPPLDFSQIVNARKTQNMFSNDPYLQQDPYAKNMGVAIVADAAGNAGHNNITLGNVFDSARDKLANKLTLQGVASVGVKTMVSNGLARLFTGAVGAVTDLDPSTRQTLVDTGTWAGAISAILH